ncbi:MAG: flagellar basal body L-ring protein FlgH [Syntrophobacter sp.]
MFNQTAPKSRSTIRTLRISMVIPAICLTIGLMGCATTAKPEKPPQTAITPPTHVSGIPPVPYPEPGPKPSSLTPTGSLWAPTTGSLFSDLRATKIGDVVTITISEESKASKAATTSTSRDKSVSGNFDFSGVSAGSMASKKGNFSFGPYSGAFANTFKGDGSTSKTDSMTAYMTATVVDVMPNGNLLIRGSRWTKVNDEMQQTILEGVVRPADISRNNTVLSQNVAEAKIFLVGKGPVSQHQKPGWLNQLLDFVSPF